MWVYIYSHCSVIVYSNLCLLFIRSNNVGLVLILVSVLWITNTLNSLELDPAWDNRYNLKKTYNCFCSVALPNKNVNVVNLSNLIHF